MERKGGLQEKISAIAEMFYRSQPSNFGVTPSSLEVSFDYNPSRSLFAGFERHRTERLPEL